VREARGVRTLHVGGRAIQSAMRLDDPWGLALDYTRCMMAALLFHPDPRKAVLIGLGGGSLVKFLLRHLPRVHVHAVEAEARVVEAARTHFGLPRDGARLRVEVGPGEAALAPECCDLLLVDAFVDERIPPALASAAFCDAAAAALGARGVLAMNFMDDDPDFDRTLARIEAAFGGRVAVMPALADPNLLVFALKGAPAAIPWSVLEARAGQLGARLGLPFARYVRALRRLNPHTPADLIIGPQGGAR